MEKSILRSVKFWLNRGHAPLETKYAPLSLFCTRHFCTPMELPHYRFCRAFFEEGEDAARSVCEYVDWTPLKEQDRFIRIPPGLIEEPRWWVMPWHECRKPLNTNPEQIRRKKKQKTNKFLALLRSIEKNGFDYKRSQTIRAHRLIKGDKDVFINQDGHHRLAALKYLQKNKRFDLIKTSKRLRIDGHDIWLQCHIEKKIRRDELPDFSAVRMGGGTV